MVHGRDLTTEADMNAALERARNQPEPVRALRGEYKPSADSVVLYLDNGRRLVLPREELQGLTDATEAQICHIEIFGGLDVAWPDLDHSLPSLLKGQFGSDLWMQGLRKRGVAA